MHTYAANIKTQPQFVSLTKKKTIYFEDAIKTKDCQAHDCQTRESTQTRSGYVNSTRRVDSWTRKSLPKMENYFIKSIRMGDCIAK